MKQRTKRFMALMVTLAMTAASAAVPVTAAENAAAIPEKGEKFVTAKTADGWIKVENEDGDTLGLSDTSGVGLLEVDGYAFKDLNQNGELDAYEDWRLTDEERTENLVGQMQGKEIAAMLTHGGWGNFTTEPLAADDGSRVYLEAGGRGGVSRSLFAQSGGDHAKWANQIQAVAESCMYGIPAMISTDPATYAAGTNFRAIMAESVSLASTMNPELAAEIGKRTAKQHRAAGVTALLGPQVDISSPVMARSGGTYGEDPQLTLDIATAYVNGMQSTYDENGEDLGWGMESVYCFTKHFAGAGATEGGRDDHLEAGRYAVFPGNNLEAHLITYFDGVFNLPGKTGSSGIMTEYAVNTDGECNGFGGELACVYNPYMNNMLDEAGFDGLKITDWSVFVTKPWGVEDKTEPERIAIGWEAGANLLGGYNSIENAVAAYDVLVANDGQEKADGIMRSAAAKYVKVMMELEMFEMPYNDSAYADSIVRSPEANAYGVETQRQSVVMIKNDGTIRKDGAVSEKPTVYIPYIYNDGFEVNFRMGITHGTPTWTPGMSLEIMGQYFNIVTDTLGEPTGEADKDGNATYTRDDIIRATPEEIAACDYVLAGMNAPYITSYYGRMVGPFGGEAAADAEDKWYPPSLQYGEYVADTAREVSISGRLLEDGTRENRSYKGNAAHTIPNYGSLEALQYAAEAAGDIPVIVSMKMERGMVWDEVEPLADVIFVNYNFQCNDTIAEMILGKTEPTGLLIFQQPKNMETVEAQLDDVPRDMECYVDTAGNTYDFAFGMNWEGVIHDARTEKYSAAPINKIQNFDYAAYAEANK